MLENSCGLKLKSRHPVDILWQFDKEWYKLSILEILDENFKLSSGEKCWRNGREDANKCRPKKKEMPLWLEVCDDVSEKDLEEFEKLIFPHFISSRFDNDEEDDDSGIIEPINDDDDKDGEKQTNKVCRQEGYTPEIDCIKSCWSRNACSLDMKQGKSIFS